jgi:xanthine dehydrogenase small subunit
MSQVAPAARLEFVLNGREVALDPASTATTLLEFLRGCGLTGSKEGCAEGECGACAVALVAPDGERSAYRVVNSCLLPLPLLAGHEVYTVESLAGRGELIDVQRAMAEAGGSQCGYCTPGFVMSLFAEQYRLDRTGPCDPAALAGNLCRCTGYRPIRDAVRSLAAPPPGVLLERLSRPAPTIDAVESERFSRPATVERCLTLLADPDATVIAGGSDLGVEANLRGRRWTRLVSLDAIGELREFTEKAESVTIGAALSLAEIARRWSDAPEVFREWLELFASPLIRNRATLGGNLVTASPIGDAAPLLLCLDARVHIAGASGRRAIPLSSFFVAYRRTELRQGEIVTAIEIPRPLPEFIRFYKVSKRHLDDISTVAAAMAMDWDGGDRVRRARFAFGGVAPTPIRAAEAESAVVSQRWNESAVDRVQRVLDRTLTPIADLRGSKEYRLGVSKSLVEKFWWERPAWQQ